MTLPTTTGLTYIATWKEKLTHDIQDTVIKSSLCDSDNVNYNTA